LKNNRLKNLTLAPNNKDSMNKIPYRPLGALLATGTILLSFSAKKKEPPNIIYIMSDDHAVKAVSCYGGGINNTPNIDALAQEGIRFTNACVGNSVSGPCRATLLTGKFSHMNGFRTNDDKFDGSQMTFPKLLQKAGYATAVIGKWHLVSNPTGFDYWNILPNQGDYYNPDFIEMGKKEKKQGYVTEIITRLSIGWLQKQTKTGKPFCLLMHHKAPHRNWLPAPQHFRDFEGVQFPLPNTFFDDYSGRGKAAAAQAMQVDRDLTPSYDLKLTRHDEPDSLVKDGMTPLNSRMDQSVWQLWLEAYREPNADFYKQNLSGKDLAIWKYNRYLHDYLATINSVDESVGEIIKFLKDNGLYDNSIIVYTSDQGFYLGEHGWFDKRFMYEQSLHTPFIIHCPGGMNKSQVCEALVQNTDFAPTLLDLAGIPVPAEMQGKSMKSLLENPKQEFRDAIYYHYYEYPGVHNVRRHLGISTKQYKLIHFYYDVDDWEFYDLKKDPDEMNNAYSQPDYKDIIKSMKQRLVDLEKEYKVPSIEEELKSIKKKQ
jgi:arylsulfatase A-like enzyme